MRKGIAAIWAVLITVIIMSGIGGGAWYYLDLQNTKDKDVMNKQINDLQKQITDLNQAAADSDNGVADADSTGAVATSTDPYLYANTTYGFSLLFNSKWHDYQIKPATVSGATATYYVCLPTTDAAYSQASTTSLAGTASMFAVSVYSGAQWTAAVEDENPTFVKIGEVGTWTVAYSSAQAYPATSVFSAAAGDVKNVVATFKTL